jgi:hypothetical protein
MKMYVVEVWLHAFLILPDPERTIVRARTLKGKKWKKEGRKEGG